MTTEFIKVNLQHEGFHCWPSAPEECAFLRHRHRHVFHVSCRIAVQHNDRAVEFFTLKHRVSAFLDETYGAEFGSLSCEQLALAIGNWLKAQKYDVQEIEVSEDGENSGGVSWK